MEKLIVISEGSVRLLTDAKKFDHKWMENIDGKWENIDTFHFEATHLTEKQIDDFIIVYRNGINALNNTEFKETGTIGLDLIEVKPMEYNGPEIDWTGYLGSLYDTDHEINWDISENRDDRRTFVVDVGEVYDDNTKVTLSEIMDSYKEEIILNDEQGTINVNGIDHIPFEKEIWLSTKANSIDETFIDPIGIDIVDDMIHLIALMTNNIVIDCEDPRKEEDILNYLSKFDLNTKQLAKDVLNHGTLAYEKVYNADKTTVDKLCKVVPATEGINVLKLKFYPNEEFDSYANMMYKTYFDFKLDRNEHVLDCSASNVGMDFGYHASFSQRCFIRKSFIEYKYFNISDISKTALDNESDADNFMNMLHVNIIEFYNDLIRSDERFKYYNFNLIA